jgi:dTDP-4-dehydrorhamnose 3,5-epimerase
VYCIDVNRSSSRIMTTDKPEHPPLKVVGSDEALLIRGRNAVISGVRARRARVLPDERGRLGEIMRADDPWFDKFGQVYFTTTYPGVVKAWHYHKLQTDHFYCLKGVVKVALYDGRAHSPTTGEVNEIYLSEHLPGLVEIPPGVYHGWMCVSDVEAYVINVTTECYNYDNPDEHRVPAHTPDIPYVWTRSDG